MNSTIANLMGAPTAPQHLYTPLHMQPQQPRVRRAVCVAGVVAALGLTLAWSVPAPTNLPTFDFASTAQAEEVNGLDDAPSRDWVPDAPSATGESTENGGSAEDNNAGDAAPPIAPVDPGQQDSGTTQDYVEPPSENAGDAYAYQVEVLSAGVDEEPAQEAAPALATPVISAYDAATGVLNGHADPGVTVRALLADGSVVAEAAADENGSFVLQLPAGTNLNDITVVAVGADGATSEPASGATFAATQSAEQQKKIRKQVDGQVGQAVSSLARDLNTSLVTPGLFSDYQMVSTQLPLSGYAFGLAAGVAASALAVGTYLGVRSRLNASAAKQQEEAIDGAPALGLADFSLEATPEVLSATAAQVTSDAESEAQREDDLELLAMALYGQDAANSATQPQEAAHAADALQLGETSAFDGALHAQDAPQHQSEPQLVAAQMDTAQMIALLGDAGVSAAVQEASTPAASSPRRAAHDGVLPGAADLSGLDVFDGALVKGDVSRTSEDSDEDWRAVAADEGPLDVSQFAPGAHDAHEPTAPTRPSPTLTMEAMRPKAFAYVAPVIGPSTPPRVLPALQREVEAVPQVEEYAPVPDLSAAQTLAGIGPGPVQNGRVPAAAKFDLDEPRQKASRRGLGIWGGHAQRIRASETLGVPQIQRGACATALVEAGQDMDAQVSCVVPEIPDVPEVNPMSTLNLGGSSFMSGLTSVVNATGYVQGAAATTVQPDVASAMSRAEHSGNYDVPMVNEDGQLPDTYVVTYDPAIYQTPVSSPAYIDYLVRDEFTHRHDSPARRAAATGQFHVIDGAAALRSSSARNSEQTRIPLH